MFSTGNLKNIAIPAVVIACICSSLTAFAQDGAPDLTFGASGFAITNISGAGDEGHSIALQVDGKIILGGVTSVNSAQPFALVRYWPNGKVDSSFGVNGRAIAGFNPSSVAYLNSIKLQQDGKIVAAGNSGSGSFALIRFNTNGTVDSSFGVNGRVVTSFGGQSASGNAMDIQTNGYIVVAGPVGCDIGVANYKTNGTLDSSFGTNGIKIIDFGACESANSIVIQPGGKILIGGATQTGAIGQFLLVRCNSNGDVDASFGTGGKTTLLPRQTFNTIYSLALQDDGKILAAGLAKYFKEAFGVARFNSAGIPDSSFGTNGIVVHQFANTSEEARAVTLQRDGKIVVAGNINDAGNLQVAMLRLKPDGAVDSTFEYDGEVRTNRGTGTFAYSILIQSDDKILLGGYNYFAATGNDFAALRFNVPSILPVKLTYFTATAVKSAVALNWVTASELNSSYFGIERGGGLSFAGIGRVNSKGSSSQLQQYTFTDLQPMQGDNYYRLKMVDKDGKVAYSNTVHFVFGTAPYLQAYPNPAKGSVSVNGLSSPASLLLIDASGKVLRRAAATGGSHAFNIQSLAAGIYFIQVKQDNKTTVLKFVKN